MARHRRVLVSVALLVAVWGTVRAAGAARPDTTRVLVAAQDLPVGHRISDGDVSVAEWAVGAGGRGWATGAGEVVGRVLAGPVRAGEALTEARLLGPGLLRGLPAGTVAVSVRVTDPAGAAPVRAGDRVDVIASTASGWSPEGSDVSSVPASTERAARNALVVSASGGSGRTGEGDDPAAGVLVLAVSRPEADRLAGAVAGASVSVVVLP